jgi:hypothetical protein
MHRPAWNLFEHSGPGLPVLLLTKRVGKMSGRPRKSERKSFNLSAGVGGVLPFPIDEGGKPRDLVLDTAASSDPSRSRFARASARARSSSAMRWSSRATSPRIVSFERVIFVRATTAKPARIGQHVLARQAARLSLRRVSR